MRFRLFRSRAFWFGVPGLVGLLWGWWFSMRHRSAARFGGLCTMGQSAGEAFVIWNSRTAWRKFEAYDIEMPVADARMMKMSMADLQEREPTIRFVFISYPWPVLGYVAGWAGLLVCRKRKYEKRPVE